MFSRLLVIFLIIVVVVVVQAQQDVDPLEGCELIRIQSLYLTKGIYDTNRDSFIDMSECEIFKENHTGGCLTHIPPYFDQNTMNALLSILLDCQHLFKNCDYDQDGFIDDVDLVNSYKTCLPNCDAVESWQYVMGVALNSKKPNETPN